MVFGIVAIMSFRRISLKKELVDEIENYIETHPEHGYRSIAQFIEDAIRRRAENLHVFSSKIEDEDGQLLQG